MQVIDWESFVSLPPDAAGQSLAMTIGVFDGVHRGHQLLLHKICAGTGLPTVVTFRQHPLAVLNPSPQKGGGAFAGDIFTLEQKLRAFEEMGVQQTVLIDFSANFSKMTGRDFIELLTNSRPVQLLALGQDFRCGHRLDTGVAEIRQMLAARGVETWVAEPVMEGGLPVSSSRIRAAFAAGDVALAEKLLGRARTSL